MSLIINLISKTYYLINRIYYLHEKRTMHLFIVRNWIIIHINKSLQMAYIMKQNKHNNLSKIFKDQVTDASMGNIKHTRRNPPKGILERCFYLFWLLKFLPFTAFALARHALKHHEINITIFLKWPKIEGWSQMWVITIT